MNNETIQGKINKIIKQDIIKKIGDYKNCKIEVFKKETFNSDDYLCYYYQCEDFLKQFNIFDVLSVIRDFYYDLQSKFEDYYDSQKVLHNFIYISAENFFAENLSEFDEEEILDDELINKIINKLNKL